MQDNQFTKWGKTRRMGPWRYALIYGSIWGASVTFFIWFFNTFMEYSDSMNTIEGILLIFLIYWVAGIIIYRYIIWRAKEKVYLSGRQTNDKKSND